MSLDEMIQIIHKTVKSDCFSDVVLETELPNSTIIRWRYYPPKKPSLGVFCKLARYCGMNPNIEELAPLYS